MKKRGSRFDLSARQLLDLLETEYGVPRILPIFDPIEELVSCILSQHTSDRSSYPAFVHLRRSFATWQDIVDAGPAVVAENIKGAGLSNQKSKSICGCLTAIFDLNGAFTLEPLRSLPVREARDWLTRLPGVGPKTASIVLCFSFGKGAVPVDTHVYRVLTRLGMLSGETSEARAHDVLLERVPEDIAARFHVALLAHGRAVCRAPKPQCRYCELANNCSYFHSGGTAKVFARSELRPRS